MIPSLGVFRMQNCAKNYLNSGEIEDRIHLTKRISVNLFLRTMFKRAGSRRCFLEGIVFFSFEKREGEVELEWAAKRQKHEEPIEQVSDLSFEGNENEEKNSSWKFRRNWRVYLFSYLNINRKPLDQWEFVQNKEKVKFYYGLPSFDILHNVFEPVSAFVAYKS